MRWEVGQRPKELSSLYKADIETLESSKSTEANIFSALVRLGRARDPLAYQFGLKLVTHSSPIMRQAAAGSIGFFDDSNVSKSLIILVKDSDKLVRLTALEALGNSKSPKRQQLTREISAYSSLSLEERFQVLLSLLATTEVAGKNLILDDLLKMISQLKSEQEIAGLLRIVALVPDNEKLKNFFQQKIVESKNADIVAIGIKYLSSLSDSWMQSRLPQQLQNRNAIMRQAAIEAIPVSCPSNRWILLEQALNNEIEDHIILAIARSADQLGGTSGLSLLTKISKRSNLMGKKVYDKIQKIKTEFKSELKPEICLNKTK